VPISRAGERYILKLDPPEYPHVVADEAYFVTRAIRAGLDAVQTEVVRDADGRSGLLVRRFDRVPRPDGTTRSLACEDGCQVLGRWPADKYSVRAEQVVAAMADHCSARAVAVRTFYQQLCLGWLTGNGDIHAKNLSILATDEGEWRASPAYDLPSTVPYDDRSAALSMAGRRRGIARRHLLEFAAAIGLRPRAATVALDELLDRLGDLDAELTAGALPFDRNTTIDTVKELRFRRRQAQRAS
jgi:serine/threonine-protein kinase HipA